MNKNNQNDGLHRFSFEWPVSLCGIKKNPYNKGDVNHKESRCAVHATSQSCYNLQKIRLYETSSPLDESFKVNFQVKLPNGSRFQPTASTPSPVTNTRQLLNLTCLYWNTGASRTIAGYVLPIHRMYSISESLHSSPADP